MPPPSWVRVRRIPSPGTGSSLPFSTAVSGAIARLTDPVPFRCVAVIVCPVQQDSREVVKVCRGGLADWLGAAGGERVGVWCQWNSVELAERLAPAETECSGVAEAIRRAARCRLGTEVVDIARRPCQ